MVRSFAILPIAALALAVSACGGTDETKPSRPVTTTTSTTSSGASSGGGGGSGGSTGAGGQGGAGQGGAGGAGQGGAGGAGQGGGISSEPLPADAPCLDNMAFRASGMSFSFPTPPRLAATLGALTYAPDTHPVGVVLLASHGAGSASLGVSALVETAAFTNTFIPGKAPSFVQAIISHGGFATASGSSKGWLRIIDESSAPVDIELNDIRLSVTTRSACSVITGTLDATIPSSQLDLALKYGDQTSTLADLADLGGGGGSGGERPTDAQISIHAIFQGESASFDFGSL